jgi:hypothetical protein
MKAFKKFSKLISITLVVLFSTHISAQDCNAALFLKEGTTLEYTNYNKKGKEESSTKHKTLSVKSDNNKLSAKIQITMEDKKNKEVFSSQYNAYCENGLISIDMSRFFDNTQLMQYDEKFTVDIDGNVLEFPINVSEGDQLNDGDITIKVSNETMTIVTMVMTISDRKVLSKESITTSAGTFECQKLSFNFETKIGFIKVKGSAIEWYNKDYVLVKSESYNKKGKIQSSTFLTNLED